MPSPATTVNTRPAPLHGQHYATGTPWTIEFGIAEEATLQLPPRDATDDDATPLATPALLQHLQIDRLDRVSVPLPRYYSTRTLVAALQRIIVEHRPIAMAPDCDCSGPDRAWPHGTLHMIVGPSHDAAYVADCLAAAVAGCSLPRWRGWLRAVRSWIAAWLQPR
jgi:hypothetical protein